MSRIARGCLLPLCTPCFLFAFLQDLPTARRARFLHLPVVGSGDGLFLFIVFSDTVEMGPVRRRGLKMKLGLGLDLGALLIEMAPTRCGWFGVGDVPPAWWLRFSLSLSLSLSQTCLPLSSETGRLLVMEFPGARRCRVLRFRCYARSCMSVLLCSPKQGSNNRSRHCGWGCIGDPWR